MSAPDRPLAAMATADCGLAATTRAALVLLAEKEGLAVEFPLQAPQREDERDENRRRDQQVMVDLRGSHRLDGGAVVDFLAELPERRLVRAGTLRIR